MDERVKRVAEFLQNHSIESQIIEFDASTKNSQLAAQMLNCVIAQIAKSIVFIAREPVVIILSGDKRVNIKKLSKLLGSTATLANPETVLQSSGYPVGGVPPFAYDKPLRVLLDKSLDRYEEVYAAGGALNAIFKIRLDELKKASGAELVDVSY